MSAYSVYELFIARTDDEEVTLENGFIILKEKLPIILKEKLKKLNFLKIYRKSNT